MDIAFWRDLSLLYLLTMQLVVTLLTAVVLYFVVRGVMIARRKVTNGVGRARHHVGIGRDQAVKIADRATEPLVRAHGEAARESAIIRTLLPGRVKTHSQTNQS